MAAKQKDVDRKQLEVEYRAGIKSLRALGSEFGLSGARIAQIAEKENWTRDLKARIHAATEAKLNNAILDVKLDVDKVEREERVVDASANLQAGTVLEQRGRIGKLSTLSDKLTEELLHETENLELYEQLGELMHAPDDKGKDKLNEIYKKVINSGSRIGSFRSLIESQKTLIGLQRQNVGLADNANGEADTPEQKTEMSDNEAARRVAFLITSTIHNQNKELPNG